MEPKELKIYVGSYANVVDFLENYFNIGNKEQALATIRQVERNAGVKLEWCVVGGECRICNFMMLYFAAEGSDMENLECQSCGNMSIEPKEIYNEFREEREEKEEKEEDIEESDGESQ